MATFVDAEERETARLRHAEEEGLAQRTMTPVIKECLRLKILSDRHSHGLPEYQTLFAEPVAHELRDDEKAKQERRKQQNREAARRCRLKKRAQRTAIENTYHEELGLKADLDAEVRCIQRELESMQKIMFDHLKSGSCRIAHLSDAHAGYTPDLPPVSVPSYFCHTPGAVDIQCPPETQQVDGRELSQEQCEANGDITPNLTSRLPELHGPSSEVNESHSWRVTDEGRKQQISQAGELFDEGRMSNWSNCEVTHGHVSPSSCQVQLFPGSQAPGCRLMHVLPGSRADSQFYKGVCSPNDLGTSAQSLNGPFDVDLASLHSSGAMADNIGSVLAACGSPSSEPLLTSPPWNANILQTCPCEDSDDAVVEAGRQPDLPKDIPRMDIQVFPEELHNLILEEIHETPDDLNGLYTMEGDKTQTTFLRA